MSLIVIEAIDAGGSQTQTDRLQARLTQAGYRVHQFHFPQEDRATGRLVYDKFLLTKNKLKFSRREQALLYLQDFFSRAEDLWALQKKAGKHVILLDRYYTSTLAYQTSNLVGSARRKLVKAINWLAVEATPALPKPDLTILIDTPVAISLQRLAGRKKDYFENRAKLTAIRNSYLKLAREQRWVIVSGVDKQGHQRTRDDIEHEIWQKVSRLLHK